MIMQVMPHLDDESNPGDNGEGNITLLNHVSEPIIDKIKSNQYEEMEVLMEKRIAHKPVKILQVNK